MEYKGKIEKTTGCRKWVKGYNFREIILLIIWNKKTVLDLIIWTGNSRALRFKLCVLVFHFIPNKLCVEGVKMVCHTRSSRSGSGCFHFPWDVPLYGSFLLLLSPGVSTYVYTGVGLFVRRTLKVNGASLSFWCSPVSVLHPKLLTTVIRKTKPFLRSHGKDNLRLISGVCVVVVLGPSSFKRTLGHW